MGIKQGVGSAYVTSGCGLRAFGDVIVVHRNAVVSDPHLRSVWVLVSPSNARPPLYQYRLSGKELWEVFLVTLTCGGAKDKASLTVLFFLVSYVLVR